MKYSHKTYAKALIKALDYNKNTEEVVLNFLKLLQKNNDFNQFKKIINFFEDLLYQKENKKKIIVEMIEEHKDLINKLKKFFPESNIIYKKNVNLIAGLRILINNEKELDFSLKNRLNQIFR